MYDLENNRCAISGVTRDNFKILITIHDELVVTYHKSIRDKAEKVLRWYMLPQVEGWPRMAGEVTYGKTYIHK